MTLDFLYSALGIVLEFAVFVVLIRRKIYRVFPVFCLFMAESFASGLIMMISVKHLTTNQYYHAYVIDFSLSSVLQVALLMELLWASLKPLKNSMPRYSGLILGIMLLLACAVLWPIVGASIPPRLDTFSNIYFHILKITATLRICIFLVIAGFSRLLAIGWKNRELQIATGLGFYSLVFMVVTLLHTYGPINSWYHFYDQLTVISFIFVLFYWLLSFLKPEPERKIIAPQMDETLLLLGGAVKSYRVAVTDSVVTKHDDK